MSRADFTSASEWTAASAAQKSIGTPSVRMIDPASATPSLTSCVPHDADVSSTKAARGIGLISPGSTGLPGPYPTADCRRDGRLCR